MPCSGGTPSAPRRLSLSLAIALGLLCSHTVLCTVAQSSVQSSGAHAAVAAAPSLSDDIWAGGDKLLSRWRQVLSAAVDKGQPPPSVFEQAFTVTFSSKEPGEVDRALGQYAQLMDWVAANPQPDATQLAFIPEFTSPTALSLAQAAVQLYKSDSKDAAILAKALEGLSSQLSQLTASSSHGFPATRRILIATLIKKRLDIASRFSPDTQSAADAIMLQLFALHKRAAALKGAVQFFHVSKSGGTNLCQSAEANGCSSRGFDYKTNCLMREFNDQPRWVTYNAHKYVQYRMSSRQALPWFVNFHTFRPNLSCQLRHAYLIQNNVTFYANEYTNPAPGPGDSNGGAAATRGSGSGAAAAAEGAALAAQALGDVGPSSEMCEQFVNLIMFRNPQDRLRSQIGWVQKLYKEFYLDVDTQRAFVNRTTGFWERLMPAGVNNYFARSLLGQRFFEYPIMEVTPKHVALAKLAALQHDILLVLEAKTRNELALRVGLGWSVALADGPIRSSAELGDAVALPLDYDTMLLRNQYDMALYDFARELQAADSLLWSFVAVADEQLGLSNGSSGACGYVSMASEAEAAERLEAAKAVEVPVSLLERAAALAAARAGNGTMDGEEEGGAALLVVPGGGKAPPGQEEGEGGEGGLGNRVGGGGRGRGSEGGVSGVSDGEASGEDWGGRGVSGVGGGSSSSSRRHQRRLLRGPAA